MASWVQVLVEIPSADVELVSGVLWDAGVAGIEERPGPEGTVTLVAGMEADALPAVTGALGQRRFEVIEVAADAGLDGWREFAQPVRVGTIEVWPAWLDAPDPVPEATVIHLDAGRSFGHGAHVTTRLALDLVQSVVAAGDTVVDVGCGSGVLSLAAVGLGAQRVLALDIAPEAVEASRHNVALNSAGDVVDVQAGTVTAAVGLFDVVIANIEAPILIELAPALSGAVSATGVIVLSGFITEQEERVRTAFGGPTGLAVAHRLEEDGWVALVLRR